MTNAITLIEAMKPTKGLVQTLLVLATCSTESDCEALLRESSDCIELFENKASSICEMASRFEKAVKEIQERLRASTVTCNATDSKNDKIA
ncbi:hypothetical protein TNCT_176801 [Trichonephila clavata]|uniref:Uncharacterized protein n=1 Tax=Trichonephila clavata TaxID=2740835 RepID=A0A8X6F0P5_TRICU|nr:hypothetical protein TNCT_176801 [Trichonephila clavata]